MAEAAAVIADAAEAAFDQHPLLPLPRVPVERVPVDQDDRLAGAVVVVVDLDVGTVLGPNLDEWHGAPSGVIDRDRRARRCDDQQL